MSQIDQIVKHLETNPHITALQAIGVYRIFNLKGRINDLRKAGFDIRTSMVKDGTGKSYARYSLAKAA